ncbi:alpha amylase C-terminal domain-containing protein [Prevotella nigrescens]|uniref:alpha amylase C-terminal domain-containing protein n=1 Tax=Prevotella nigrescens TaxID=28133 RepID=UPI0002FEADB9|nr:alpha amylase C-terminal domain-containing protein [Prevotella nigrescens]UAK27976.1 alpha amylase C-terminal domain-containing protein [Prevotella nigrescens]WMS21273.1 alpha amylase C-terminal domain-containing protein [Prevotella nigrescens]SUB92598.1 1,4-alpha-glucan branching enzyme GlgB [Prevotella nigrescens]
MKIQDKITAAKRAEDNAQLMGIVKNDSYLVPFNEAICGRHNHAVERIKELTFEGKQTLSDFANGYNYYGLHKTNGKWIFREWVPNATNLYLIGDFNNWERSREYQCKRIEGTAGDWELILDEDKIHHGDLFKMYVFWNGGEGERIPAWAQRVVQDEGTKIFSAQVWFPEEEYQWKHKTFKPNRAPLLIYECHIGMGQDAEKVGTYIEFRKNVLPRIVDEGYNAIQIMAIQEHPYYGSFGYHVSSFFAPSSRFGTPEELKELIDEAHSNGLAVIMDIVHSHAVKNEIEGLGNLAGDPNQYFYPGERHEHPAWDSLCFDYGKNEVLHFLLSNCKFWLEEYHFDGFRFDGVTSMLYYSHGLGEAFCNYADYFNGHQDDNAICYLTLANCLIHEVNSHAITIAEEVSGMPGLAAKFKDGGYGFDYRMAMNIPDYWIKTIKELPDEEWKPSSIFWEVKNRRSDERTISYCESHDQALVGDKTIIFRLIDADMYWHFKKGDENDRVRRGIALHKMIRLVTAGTINGGYLNFMGNEFGHPEWIDFPREGNGWSYKYARRQWNLVDNKELCYHYLGDFDKKMLEVIKSEPHFNDTPLKEIWHNDTDQILAFSRNQLIFVFNFSPTHSFSDYGFLVPNGTYNVVLNTDSWEYGGFGFVDENVKHMTLADPLYEKDGKGWLKLYIPARSALVLRKKK